VQLFIAEIKNQYIGNKSQIAGQKQDKKNDKLK
jgi:hypothetical protein